MLTPEQQMEMVKQDIIITYELTARQVAYKPETTEEDFKKLLADNILKSKLLAVLHPDQTVPYPLATLRMSDPRYQDGAMIHAEKLMLTAGWVRVVKE